MYYIEKNIPIPTLSKKPKGPLRLTMEEMKVGDSIQVGSDKRTTSYGTAFAIGIKIKTIVQDDDYVRIWRIK